jgi:hypothetical protein
MGEIGDVKKMARWRFGERFQMKKGLKGSGRALVYKAILTVMNGGLMMSTTSTSSWKISTNPPGLRATKTSAR